MFEEKLNLSLYCSYKNKRGIEAEPRIETIDNTEDQLNQLEERLAKCNRI